MEAYAGQLTPDEIWSVVSWIRAQQAHEGAEPTEVEKREHQQGGKH
jgi:mono/diheme cytochrome c family protein